MGLKPGAGTREMQSTQGGRPLELLPKGAPQTGRCHGNTNGCKPRVAGYLGRRRAGHGRRTSLSS